MSSPKSGRITQNTTTSGRGLNRRVTTSTTTTTDIPGVTLSNIKVSRSVGEKLSLGGNLLGLIVGILLIVSLIKSLTGSGHITFGGLLETLADAPSINMSMSSFDVISPLQWDGILSGLASFFNFFITIFNVLIFAFKGLSQVVIYVLWVVRFLFF